MQAVVTADTLGSILVDCRGTRRVHDPRGLVWILQSEDYAELVWPSFVDSPTSTASDAAMESIWKVQNPVPCEGPAEKEL